MDNIDYQLARDYQKAITSTNKERIFLEFYRRWDFHIDRLVNKRIKKNFSYLNKDDIKQEMFLKISSFLVSRDISDFEPQNFKSYLHVIINNVLKSIFRQSFAEQRTVNKRFFFKSITRKPIFEILANKKCRLEADESERCKTCKARKMCQMLSEVTEKTSVEIYEGENKRSLLKVVKEVNKKFNKLPKNISINLLFDDNLKNNGDGSLGYKTTIGYEELFEEKELHNRIKEKLKMHLTLRQYEDFLHRRIERTKTLEEMRQRWNCSSSVLSHDYSRNVVPKLKLIRDELFQEEMVPVGYK